MEPAENATRVVLKIGVIVLAILICLVFFMAGHVFVGVAVFALGIAFVMFLGARRAS